MLEFLADKKIYISPYSKTSDVLRKKLENECKNAKFLGFIDKIQKGENINKFDDIYMNEFDYILICSPNHFESIYKDYTKKISKNKLIKVENNNNSYKFLNKSEQNKQKFLNIPQKFREFVFRNLANLYEITNYKRKKIILISKNFVGGNNKFLYFALIEQNFDVIMLTDNKSQLKELEKLKMPALLLSSLKAHIELAKAKWIVVDQGDNTNLINQKAFSQKTMQLWHGIPLEHMNLLTNITYDIFISTSDFVSFTSFDKVFQAKEFLSCGYPRNDVFLKQNHSKNDLIFTDKNIYEFAKNAKANSQKIIIYMPTFRESDFITKTKQINSLNLDFEALNKFLKTKNAFFILKLHPFVAFFYKDFLESLSFSNILFHDTKGDIYPILKFADILVSDYSSVYYDFLLINKPILYYLYDHKTCSKMAHGYLYEFDEMSPGEKSYNQSEFFEKLAKIIDENDDFANEREKLKNKLFAYKDEFSSKRIIKVLEK